MQGHLDRILAHSSYRQLQRLPIRLATLLDLDSPQRSKSDRSSSSVDPGVALQELQGQPGLAPSEFRCWNPCPPLASEARDRLWRFATAIGVGAEQLARDRGHNAQMIRKAAAVGLIQPLGYWAIATLNPGALETIVQDKPVGSTQGPNVDPFGNHQVQRLGVELAQRWQCPQVVLEIQASRSARVGDSSQPEESELLDLVSKARRWALQTPWGAPNPGLRANQSSEPRTRWLIAEVQARTVGRLDRIPGLTVESTLERLATELTERLNAENEVEARREGMVTQRDQTERRPDAQISNESAIRLERLEALAEFAAGAGHELNNPLAVIAGRAQLLRSRIEGEEAQRSLQTIIKQAFRAHQIIRDLMYVARPPEPREVPCLPNQLLLDVLEDLGPTAEVRAIQFQSRVSNTRTTFMGDPDGFRHLADVILRNAIEATPDGGRIAVRALIDQHQLVWLVSNSGEPMKDKDRKHLLDPFYCGREAGRGLGLGLPRVARYLDRLGGKISWLSGSEQGTVTKVMIPIS